MKVLKFILTIISLFMVMNSGIPIHYPPILTHTYLHIQANAQSLCFPVWQTWSSISLWRDRPCCASLAPSRPSWRRGTLLSPPTSSRGNPTLSSLCW